MAVAGAAGFTWQAAAEARQWRFVEDVVLANGEVYRWTGDVDIYVANAGEADKAVVASLVASLNELVAEGGVRFRVADLDARAADLSFAPQSVSIQYSRRADYEALAGRAGDSRVAADVTGRTEWFGGAGGTNRRVVMFVFLDSPSEMRAATVVHELGHAIGLIGAVAGLR